MKFKLLFKMLPLLLAVGFITSCSDDDDDGGEIITPSADFTVTIENVFVGKNYFSGGPTGLITPGMSEMHSFQAGRGQYLSFATMLVQSNDLFFAPRDGAILLFDADGNPRTGDITDDIVLWDAGTEVNEEPGFGPNQPIRQSGPDTGMDENGVIHIVDDSFTYPASSDLIQVMLSHDGGTTFTIEIRNVSNGKSLESPLAPGYFVVSDNDPANAIFTAGQAASDGLEDLAEDGDHTLIVDALAASTGLVSPFAPGAFGLSGSVFSAGSNASSVLEALAEDGDASGFEAVFSTPDGASSPGPIFPGSSYSFSFTTEEGASLNFATMLVQSNDLFIGVENLELFNNGSPISGDITSSVSLYDAGTEVDEYAGAGPNQPVRQEGPNTGEDEGSTVGLETSPSDNIPSVEQMVRVTITTN